MNGFIEITLKQGGEKTLINTNHIYFVNASILSAQYMVVDLKDIEETYEEIKEKIILATGGKITKSKCTRADYGMWG